MNSSLQTFFAALLGCFTGDRERDGRQTERMKTKCQNAPNVNKMKEGGVGYIQVIQNNNLSFFSLCFLSHQYSRASNRRRDPPLLVMKVLMAVERRSSKLQI